MARASKMCGSCPFRGSNEAYKQEYAAIPGADWPCHTEDLYGESGIQCRGHWEAVRKYAPADTTQHRRL